MTTAVSQGRCDNLQPLLDLFAPDRRPTPERVMTVTGAEIRAVGFSRPKVTFIQDLAAHVLDGRLDLKGLRKHPDEEVMRQLVQSLSK